MSDENPMGHVIQIDEARIRDHLGEMVRGTVEETLNAMLDAEADQLCGAGRYERSQARQDTRAGSYDRTHMIEPTSSVRVLWRPIQWTSARELRDLRPSPRHDNGRSILVWSKLYGCLGIWRFLTQPIPPTPPPLRRPSFRLWIINRIYAASLQFLFDIGV